MKHRPSTTERTGDGAAGRRRGRAADPRYEPVTEPAPPTDEVRRVEPRPAQAERTAAPDGPAVEERRTGTERRLAELQVEEERRLAERRVARHEALERRRYAVGRVTQAVDYVFYLLYGLLAIRGVLALLGASQTAGFVQFINNLTQPFYAPFSGIVGRPAIDGGVIDFPLIIALLAYAVLHIAIRGLIRLTVVDRTKA